MRIIAGLLVAAAFGSTPTFASGGFWCDTENSTVKFKIESGLTRGTGNPIFGFRGDLEIFDKTIPDDLRKSVFTQENLMQHWLDNKILNLQLHRERAADGPFGEIDLTIQTKLIEEGSYKGAYELRVYASADDASGDGKTIELAGTTSCFAE